MLRQLYRARVRATSNHLCHAAHCFGHLPNLRVGRQRDQQCGWHCRLPIFLFNYNDRLMHGIFRATSNGELEINPHGVVPATQTATLLKCVMQGTTQYRSRRRFADNVIRCAAWTGTEHLKTRFPAQVRVERWKKCQAIHERCVCFTGMCSTRIDHAINASCAATLEQHLQLSSCPPGFDSEQRFCYLQGVPSAHFELLLQ